MRGQIARGERARRNLDWTGGTRAKWQEEWRLCRQKPGRHGTGNPDLKNYKIPREAKGLC